MNVVTTALWDNNWKALVAGSAVSKWPDYGTFRTGKIDLQDWAGEVWFTNIKIQRLDAGNANTGGIAQTTPITQNPSPGAQGQGQSQYQMQNQNPAPGARQGDGPDLSGIWEGQQTNGNLVMYYQLGLVSTGDNTYTGFDSCLWVRNNDNSPLNVKGPMPHAKKSLSQNMTRAFFGAPRSPICKTAIGALPVNFSNCKIITG